MPLRITDIRLWILLAFAIRLVGIQHPPLEVGHNWRQSTVCMVARNYHEQGIDLLHPRVDMAGEKTGITGMEFPLLNALMAGTSSVFGFQHWYGRLLVLLVSSLGVWCFFLMLRRRWSWEIAFPAAVTLLFSLWFVYSRKSMPDTFAASLVLVGMWWLMRFLDLNKPARWLYFGGGGVLIGLGLLSKIPAGVLLAGLLPLLFLGAGSKRDKWFILALAPLGLPACWWYFSWVPHLVDTYGFWHFFMGKSMAVGAGELAGKLDQVGLHFAIRSVKVVAFGAMLVGAAVAIRKRMFAVLLCFGVGFLALGAVALKAGNTFAGHDYYMIPFVPFMALLVGCALANIKKPVWRWALIGVIALEGVANQYHDLFPSDNQWIIADVEATIEPHVPVDALVAVNSGENPTPLYFTHRKGWVMGSAQLSEPAQVDSLQGLGLEYVVWFHKTWSDGGGDAPQERLPGTLVHSTPAWSLLQLGPIH